MSIAFPSLDFFQALQAGMAGDPASTEGIEPSEAYCGLAIGDDLFVLEFDGRECSAVVPNGNPLDLDFVLAASPETWQETIHSIVENAGADPEHSLAALVETGAIEVRSEQDDGPDLARAALGMLQAFLDQAKEVDTALR